MLRRVSSFRVIPASLRSIVGPQWNAFAPRIGFAWDVFGDGKTSVRGGYGVFFNQLNADTLAQQNAPYSGVFNAFTTETGPTRLVPPVPLRLPLLLQGISDAFPLPRLRA